MNCRIISKDPRGNFRVEQYKGVYTEIVDGALAVCLVGPDIERTDRCIRVFAPGMWFEVVREADDARD